MKTKSPESAVCRADDMAKSTDNCGASYNPEQQLNSDNNRPAPDTMTQTASEKSSKNEMDSKDADGPGQILTWISEALKALAINSGTTDIKELEKMISTFLGKVSSCISKCYVPNRAAKMKRHMSDVLLFFNFVYQEIAEETKVDSTYLDTMAHLMAYYIDMEIQASSRAKENPLVIASKITSCLYIFLDKSHNHILDSILKANNMNKNFWELSSLIFSGVLKDSPSGIMDELTYVRYILVYKMWKRVVQGADERKKIVALASRRLKHPPQFVDKIRAGLLNGIIPKIPRKRADVTSFLIQAKFDVKEKAKAFLKYVSESKNNVMFVPPVPAIKVDIPLLVGHLPDFGPSPSFVLSQPLELDKDEDDPQKVDMSGSRLMNDIWTSINHKASFREAIRMQNVTTFSRADLKLKEKKVMLRALKQRKAKVKPVLQNEESPSQSVPEEESTEKVNEDEPNGDSSPCKPDVVINEDNEKSNEDVAVDKIVTPPAPAPEVAQIDKRKECQVSVPVRPLMTREPSPPPVPTPPPPPEVLPPSPEPEIIILDPSEIKQEDEDSNDVIIVSPAHDSFDGAGPSNIGENRAEAMKTPVEAIKENSILNKHFQQNIDGLSPSKKDVPPIQENDSEGKIADNGLSIKETEVNIRINRDLFANIKASSSLEKEQISSEIVKPTESCESSRIDIGDEEVPVCPSPEIKANSLFDDEESSWSPSGTSQEFFRNVVDNFISGESPGHDLEVNASCSIAPTIMTPDSIQVHKMETEDNLHATSLIPSVHDSVEMEPPPAKRFCVSGSLSSNIPTQEVTDDIYNKPYEPMYAEVPADNHKLMEKEAEIINEVPVSLHYTTLRRDHSIFLSQSKFREMYILLQNMPSDLSVPSPTQPNPETGSPYDRCECEQCKGNFDALVANYHALVGFVIATASARECQAQDSDAIAALETQAQTQMDDECSDQVDESMLDPNDAAVDLPFKKRKFVAGSDGKERMEETVVQAAPPEPTVYPATPMLSIASLAENRSYVAPLNHEFHQLTPFQTTCSNVVSNGQMIITQQSSQSDLSHNNSTHTSRTSRKCYPIAPTTTKDNYHSSNTSRPLGGGFPPFSSVITPASTSHLPADDGYEAATLSSIEEHKKRRTFRTPAQLKAMWEPGARISSPVPVTTSAQLVADTNYNNHYYTRHSTNNVATEREVRTTRKRKSSRRRK